VVRERDPRQVRLDPTRCPFAVAPALHATQTTGVLAPTTEIQATRKERKQLKVRVAAVDKVGVVKVELYVDGRRQARRRPPSA